MTTFEILRGDVLEILPAMPEASVHMVVTSPPYWGLRDYKIEPSIWPSGWRGCLGLEPTIDLYVEHMVHVFRLVRRVMRPEATLWLNLGDCYVTKPHGAGSTFDPKYPAGRDRSEGFRCNRTNHPSDLGLKSKDLCMIPATVALALRKDGWYVRSDNTWFKHNGMPESVDDRPVRMTEQLFQLTKSEDAYYDREAARVPSSANSHARGDGVNPKARMMGPNSRMRVDRDPEHQTGAHIKAKQNRSFSAAVHSLVPSRARRNTDWFFDSIEEYQKGFQGMLLDQAGDPAGMVCNPQPFSLEMCEACETCYETREYRQLQAILTCESCKRTWDESGPKLSRHCSACGSDKVQHVRVCTCGAKTWVSHFATFPERLVQPCILLGTSEHGCCSVCGAPYVRVLEKQPVGDWHPDPEHKHDKGAVNGTVKWAKENAQSSGARVIANVQAARDAGRDHDNPFLPPVTVGWEPSCSHPLFPAGEPVPCTVLDPFAGSGRAGLATVKLGRNFKGIEINPKFARMAEWQAEKLTPATAVQEAALT